MLFPSDHHRPIPSPQSNNTTFSPLYLILLYPTSQQMRCDAIIILSANSHITDMSGAQYSFLNAAMLNAQLVVAATVACHIWPDDRSCWTLPLYSVATALHYHHCHNRHNRQRLMQLNSGSNYAATAPTTPTIQAAMGTLFEKSISAY